MMEYWLNLTLRERLSVLIAGLFILFFLIYFFLYQPLTSTLLNARQQYVEKQETLTWMKGLNVGTIKKNLQQSVETTQLLRVISEELNQNSLKEFPYQLQQINTGDLQIHYDKVPFNDFIVWLWKLNNNYSLIIKQLTIERLPVSGLIKSNVILASSS